MHLADKNDRFTCVTLNPIHSCYLDNCHIALHPSLPSYYMEVEEEAHDLLQVSNNLLRQIIVNGLSPGQTQVS